MLTNKDMAQVMADEPVESPTTETESEVTQVETPPTGDEPQEPAVVEEPTPEPKPEEVVEEPVVTKEEPAPTEPSTPSTEQRRPSRAERKIHRQARTIHTLEEQLAAFQNQKHEFQPSETKLPENGEIDLPTLERFIGERSQQAVQTVLQQQQAFQEYKEAVLDWSDDLAETIASAPELNPQSPEYNPELESLLHETLQKANFDAQGNPDPKLYASEVWEKMQNAIKKSTSKAKVIGEAEAAAKLQQQVDESAIAPSSSKAPQAKALTDEEKAKLQLEKPREYTDLVRKGLI